MPPTAAPSLPATQRAAAQLAQPDDEQIMRARARGRTRQRWLCVCGGGLDVAGRPAGLPGHIAASTAPCAFPFGPCRSCIASAPANMHCDALRCTATQGSSQPARHDSTQNSSLHARTHKAVKPAPSSLERRPSAGLTAAQCATALSACLQPAAVPQVAVILTATRPVSSLACKSHSGLVMQPPQTSGIGRSGVSGPARTDSFG